MRKSVKASSGIKALKEDLIFTGQLPDVKGLKRELRKRGELPPKQLLKRLAGQDEPMPPSNVSTKKSDEPITPVEYGGLQAAFDYLNIKLFDGTLPNVFITYQRRSHSGGYFSPDRFTSRAGVGAHHEIVGQAGFHGHLRRVQPMAVSCRIGKRRRLCIVRSTSRRMMGVKEG